jgi:phosphoribosylformylglycinamidine synthase
LAVALAQVAFAGDIGMEIDLGAVPTEDRLQNEKILYSESAGRFVVTVASANVSEFEKMFEGIIFKKIGTVSAGRELWIFRGNKTVVKEDVRRLKKSWQRRFRNF